MKVRYFKGARVSTIKCGEAYFNDQGKDAEVVGTWGDYFLVVHHMGNLWRSPTNTHQTVNKADGLVGWGRLRI